MAHYTIEATNEIHRIILNPKLEQDDALKAVRIACETLTRLGNDLKQGMGFHQAMRAAGVPFLPSNDPPLKAFAESIDYFFKAEQELLIESGLDREIIDRYVVPKLSELVTGTSVATVNIAAISRSVQDLRQMVCAQQQDLESKGMRWRVVRKAELALMGTLGGAIMAVNCYAPTLWSPLSVGFGWKVIDHTREQWNG